MALLRAHLTINRHWRRLIIMAQIDLLNLLKATAPTGVGSPMATKAATTPGLFEQILGDQKVGLTKPQLGGNSLPSGNALPPVAMTKLHQQQVQNQTLASLTVEQQDQIDDLSFITQLQPAADMPMRAVVSVATEMGQQAAPSSWALTQRWLN